MSCLNNNTREFCDFLINNSHNLLGFHSEKNGKYELIVKLFLFDKFYHETNLFYNSVLLSKRLDLSSFEHKQIDRSLLLEINLEFKKVVDLLHSKKHLIPYVEGILINEYKI